MVASDLVALFGNGGYAATGRFLAIFSALDLLGLETDGLLGLSPTFVS